MFLTRCLCAILILVILFSCPIPALASREDRQDNSYPSLYVDPIDLTEIRETIVNGLNIGVVLSDQSTANGVQKAADIWGLHVDIFVPDQLEKRTNLLEKLAQKGNASLITDAETLKTSKSLTEIINKQRKNGNFNSFPVVVIGDTANFIDFEVKSLPSTDDRFTNGFEALKVVRASLIDRIPKYDELFNISFPITPIPDSFFQATKFPYPDPVLRSVRTVSSASASAHAHTSCHAVAKLGNMIHRTTAMDEGVFLLGFEGGNLAIKAMPDAVTPDKVSAVMTSYVIGIRGNASEKRDLLSENDGLPTSSFKTAIHAPADLNNTLSELKEKGIINDFEQIGNDEVILRDFKGQDRRFRASFFMISSDKQIKTPKLYIGSDRFGRWTLELNSVQGFIQLLGEVPMNALETPATQPEDILSKMKLVDKRSYKQLESLDGSMPGKYLIKSPRRPRGGLMTEAGAMVGSVVGFPLGYLLQKVEDPEFRFQPYILTLEGGFLSVTPESTLTDEQIRTPISRIDIDERGPLGSDQTILVTLQNKDKITFRRTVLNFSQVDQALETVKDQALISGWEYIGARGRGLAANVVLYNFLGKHRKFMSSLNTWPSQDRPERPYLRWYVDGMQRLNFSVITPQGWRQEFVEVPIQVPPIPRDVELFSGQNQLD